MKMKESSTMVNLEYVQYTAINMKIKIGKASMYICVSGMHMQITKL